MSFIRIERENSDGSRQLIEQIGDDPLRDDAPKGQIEREIEQFEQWVGAKKLAAARELGERISWVRDLQAAAHIASRRGYDDLAEIFRFLGKAENSDLGNIKGSGQIAIAEYRAAVYERTRPQRAEAGE